MPSRTELATHRLINRERRKRGVRQVHWDRRMYRLAKTHSRSMAKARFLFHSDRYALQGGENCYAGTNSAATIVKTWMRSKAGHREWLLDSRVRKAAVGITARGKTAYVAWSFSSGGLDTVLYDMMQIFRKLKRGIKHFLMLEIIADTNRTELTEINQ